MFSHVEGYLREVQGYSTSRDFNDDLCLLFVHCLEVSYDAGAACGAATPAVFVAAATLMLVMQCSQFYCSQSSPIPSTQCAKTITLYIHTVSHFLFLIFMENYCKLSGIVHFHNNKDDFSILSKSIPFLSCFFSRNQILSDNLWHAPISVYAQMILCAWCCLLIADLCVV